MHSQTKKVLILGAVILFIFAAGYFYSPKRNHFHQPSLNKNADGYLTDAEIINLRKSITYFEQKIRTEPGKIENYINLATLKMQHARLSGDHHANYPAAQQLVDKVLRTEPVNFEAVLIQATIHMNYHRFEKAKIWAEKAISINSLNALAWGIYSDALKELGDYDAAVEACDKMLSIRPDLRSYSRAAHLRELYGDIKGAKAAMRMAVNSGIIGFESHSWALHQLGNLFIKEGKIDSAEYIYNAILEITPKYAAAYSGLGEVALVKENYVQALNYLHKAYEISPLHEFAETLVIVYRLSGDSKKAEKLTKYVISEFEAHEKHGWEINLEYAKFCLENNINLNDALQRISQEFKRRPKHRDVIATFEMAIAKTSDS